MYRFVLPLCALVLGLAGCAGDLSSTVTANGVSLVSVDADALAPGETSLLDLTAEDVIYEVSFSDPTSLDRVRVLDEELEVGLDEWLARYPESASSPVRLAGDASDLWTFRAASTDEELGGSSEALTRGTIGGGGSLGYTCSLFMCSCTGDIDCNDMFTSGACPGDAYCDDTTSTPTCYCTRWGTRIRR